VALGLIFTAARTSPAYSRLMSSAQSFEHTFRDLGTARSLNPIERFVFSLVLAQTPSPGK